MDSQKISKKLNLYRLYSSRLLNYPFIKPKSFTLTLTLRCNLQCIMCSHWKMKKINELTTDEWKNIIDQIADWGIKYVEICGGEPLMRDDLFEIIEYLTTKDINLNMTTNFTLLDKHHIRALFDSSLYRVQVSIDGIGSVHDQIRGKSGTFDKVMDNVDYFNEVKKKRGSSMQLNATTVIMNKNIHQLIDLYHFTKENGLYSITYLPVQNSNVNLRVRNSNNQLLPEKDQISLLEEVIKELIEIRKKDMFLGNTIEHIHIIKKLLKGEHLDYVKCYTGFLMGIISPYGSIWNCMGNYSDLRKDTLKKAWFSEEGQTKRKAMKNCNTPCFLNRVVLFGIGI